MPVPTPVTIGKSYTGSEGIEKTTKQVHVSGDLRSDSQSCFVKMKAVEKYITYNYKSQYK